MATRYWVGGSGNWDATTTTNWATSSGGAGGASAPTSADDVIFDANSNTGTTAFVVTVTGTGGAASSCANFSTGGAGGALDGAMTLSLGATAVLDSYGSLTLPASNFTWSGTSGCYIRLRGTGSYTITTNGVSLTSTNIAGYAQGTWTLGSAFTTAAALDWQQGTLNTSNFNISAFNIIFQTASSKTFNAGSSTITSTSVAPINYSGSNLTFNAGTSQINCSNAASTFAGGGLTFYNVSFTSTALSSISISGSNTFNNLTFAARAAAGVATLTLPTTTTVNGTLTLGSGTTGVARLIVRSASTGTAVTLSVAALTAITDIDFKDITASGAASPFSGTRIGDAGGNTNITGATPRTVYWNSAASANWNAAVWSTSSGSTGGTTTAFPLAQDTIIIDNAGLTTGNTITIQSGANYYIGTLDLSTRSNAANLAIAAANSFVGNYTLSSAITLSGTGTLSFVKGSGTQTITSANVTFTQPVNIFSGSTNPVRINGNLTLSSTSTLTLTTGTLDLTNNGAGNYNLSVGLFSSSSAAIRAIIMGSGTLTLSGTGTVWNAATSTNLTITPDTSTILLSDTSTTARTFAGGGKTYNNITIGGTTGTSTTTFTGSNTFNTFASTKTVAHTITFTAGTTTTVRNWTITGTSGNVVTINSSTASTQATLSKSSGTISNLNYLSIKDSNATGGATWYAGSSSTNISNNTGWIFTSFYTSAFSVSSTITNVLTKLSYQSISIASTVVSSLSKLKSMLMTIAQAITVNNTLVKLLNKTITQNITITVLINQLKTFLKSITISSTATISIVKKTLKNIISSISVSLVLSQIKTIFSGLISILGTGLLTALGALNVSAISNIFGTGTVSPKGEIIGEGWNAQATGTETWTDTNKGSETWTEVTTNNNDWLRQG